MYENIKNEITLLESMWRLQESMCWKTVLAEKHNNCKASSLTTDLWHKTFQKPGGESKKLYKNMFPRRDFLIFLSLDERFCWRFLWAYLHFLLQ